MLNPLNSDHRTRLARAADHSWQELQKYNRQRAVTIQAYLGLHPKATAPTGPLGMANYRRHLSQGNLLQLAGLSHQIALASGEPRFLVHARTPENAGMALTLEPALNRMASLLDLGEVHRNVAADSFFGYGIYKVGVGRMTPAAQIATGLQTGPSIWRVDQNAFLYDISAVSWEHVSYVGDFYPMDLDDAIQEFPHAADRLNQYTQEEGFNSMLVRPEPTNLHTPTQRVWIADVYFPQAKLVAKWPVRLDSFQELANEPLQVMEYKGHWSGVYQVLDHLYSPGEITPVAQAESAKELHFIFQDLMHRTSNQALKAKVNPVFQQSATRDMQRLMDSDDRDPVSTTNNPAALKELFQIPGPTQSQTAYISTVFELFKQMVPTFDEPQRAPTATQGQLVRETTNAIVAEARRKAARSLQLVGYKLGWMLLNDQRIVLPATRPLAPGSRVQVPAVFGPGPRTTRIDDFDLAIDPFSVNHRDPQERIQQVTQSTQIIIQMMQMQLQGAPINIETVLDTLARYQDLPELRDWFEPADPLRAATKARSEANPPRPGVGEYVRRNVSERTDAGALQQSLTQVPTDNGEAMPDGS